MAGLRNKYKNMHKNLFDQKKKKEKKIEVHNMLISVLFPNKNIYKYIGKMLFTPSITPTSLPLAHLSYGFLVLCVDLFLLFQVFCRGDNSPPWTANQCFFQTVFWLHYYRCSAWPSSILLLCWSKISEPTFKTLDLVAQWRLMSELFNNLSCYMVTNTIYQ